MHLPLLPGDVIVCKTDDRVTMEAAERVQSALTRVFPGHEVLITSNCSIEVGRPEQFDGSRESGGTLSPEPNEGRGNA